MNDGMLIVGARGLIGSSLARWADAHGLPWRGTRSRAPQDPSLLQLDLRRDEDIDRLAERPRIAYLLAAETNLRRCEEQPAETRRVNVEQTLRLARRLHAAGAALVFLSTNLVFDGTRAGLSPDDPPSPVTEYGRQKAELEGLLRAELPRTAIVRLTKVVHPDFALFRDWLATLQRGKPVRPFSDMPFCPVDLDLVTEELGALAVSFRPGILHLSGDADLSYADAARLLAEARSLPAELIQPQTTREAGFGGAFPRHTQLAFKGARPDIHAPRSVETLREIFRRMA
jgi:dTDP-4-dehydrorhamnose reductase